MLRFFADENFNQKILDGLYRRLPTMDVLRVQDTAIRGAEDSEVLAWAASEDRILLTHDVSTMTAYAYERLARGETMPGVFVIPGRLPIGLAIENLVVLAECSVEGEWEGQVLHLPF